MSRTRTITSLILLFALVACGGGGSSGSGGSSGGGTSSGNDGSIPGIPDGIERLTDDEYEALSAEQKYAVANKLMATLYKGISVKNFFIIDGGIDNMRPMDNGDFISNLETQLSQPLEDRAEVLATIDETYDFDSKRIHQQYPLAMLLEFPVSKDFFQLWMAYKLANTILFSPALELETTGYTDIQDIFYRLVSMMADEYSITEIVYEHMVSQENWRRFRSPEDNTREMMEIFLGRFEDEEVPKAAQACKNWYLTDDSQDYQLVIGFDENSEPQEILDTEVTSCYDFYWAVAEHPALIPRITSILVGIFLPDYSISEKERLVDDIVLVDPQTFDQIFSSIIFSKEYLLHAERPKEFEETFFNVAHRIEWYAFASFFKYVNSTYSSPSLPNMRQASMTYKLGRPLQIPLDTLSFSYYHKLVREKLLIDRKTDDFNDYDGGWEAAFIDVELSGDDFIHYLFLSVLSRKASQTELEALNQVIELRGYNREEKKMHRAMIVMDYFSRLSELYYFTAIS